MRARAFNQVALESLKRQLPAADHIRPAWQAGLETRRLLLRPPRREDMSAWTQFYAQGGAAGQAAADQAEAEIQHILQHAQDRGFSMWAVEDKATGLFAGRVGPWMPLGWPGLEFGWAMSAQARGRRFAKEAAVAGLTWVRGHLGAGPVLHTMEADNGASAALAQTLGAKKLGQAMIGPALRDVWVSTLG